MISALQDIAQKAAPIFSKYGFTKVGVFGSRSRDDFHEKSDIDFLYSGRANISFSAKFKAQEELEKKFGVEVDLVDDRHVIARMRPKVKQDLKIIYER